MGLWRKLAQGLGRLLQLLSRLEKIFLCTLLMGMILLACLQIILRDLFAGGFLWADSLLRYMVLWSGLLGAALATGQGKHITIDLASHLLPEKAQRWLSALLHLVSAGVCGVLTHAAATFVRNEAAFSGRDLLSVPSWAWSCIFPGAFALMTLRFLVLGAAGIAGRGAKPLPGSGMAGGRDVSGAPGPGSGYEAGADESR